MKNKIIHAISVRYDTAFTITAEPARTRTVMVAGGRLQRISTPGIVLVEKRRYYPGYSYNDASIWVFGFEPGTKQIGMEIPNLYYLAMSHMENYLAMSHMETSYTLCLRENVCSALNRGEISAHEALWCTEFSEVSRVECSLIKISTIKPFALKHCFRSYDIEYDPPGVIDL